MRLLSKKRAMTSPRHLGLFLTLGLFWGISPSLYRHWGVLGVPVSHIIFLTGIGVVAGIECVVIAHDPTVRGVGLQGLKPPAGALDMGNAGTGMRLLAGLMAGQRFGVTLVGDESLSRRPMRRVIGPLSTRHSSQRTPEPLSAPESMTE